MGCKPARSRPRIACPRDRSQPSAPESMLLYPGGRDAAVMRRQSRHGRGPAADSC